MTIYCYVFSPGEGYTLSISRLPSDTAYAFLNGWLKDKEGSGRKIPPYMIDIVDDDNHKVSTIRGGGF